MGPKSRSGYLRPVQFLDHLTVIKMINLGKRIVATPSCPDKLSSQLFNESFQVRQSPLLALNVKRLKILLEMLQSADVIQYLSYLSLKYQSI